MGDLEADEGWNLGNINVAADLDGGAVKKVGQRRRRGIAAGGVGGR